MGVDQNQRYHYNAAGELLRAEFSGNPWRDSIYRYDARGRRIRETSVGQDHQYFYDELGNVTKMIHGGTLRCITSTYDALNRLQTCTETAKGEPLTSGRVTRYNYDLAGNILRKWLPSNMAEYKIFDAGGRCTTTIFTQVNRTLLHPSQTKSAWDAFGNLIWQQDERTAAGAVAAVSQRTLNRYDGLNRLTDELTYAGQSTSASQSDSYAYDAANNRTSLIRKAGSAAPVVLNYDFSIATLAPHLAADQAIQYAPNQLRRITKVTNGVDSVVAEFRYDKNGNRLSKWEVAADGPSIASYAWDRANRLVRVDRTGGNAGTQTWRFGYDHRTRRILRNDPGAGLEMVSFAGGTSANTWQVAGDTPTKTLAAPQLSAEYIRGSDFGGGVGGILYSINGPATTVGGGVGASRMYEYGARGDVTGLSDSSGATTFRSVYQAFGNHVDSGVAGAGRQRASTKEEESALGLLNEGFRHRDIATGVFLSRDPAGFVDGPNLYCYVSQNPWSAFDPDGLAERYIIMGGTSVGDPEHDRAPLNFSQAMVNTLRSMPKAERKNTEVVIYGPAYRERALADAEAETAAHPDRPSKLTENSYLDRFTKDARFLGAKVTIAESAKDVVATMGKASDGEIKKATYFGHSGPLHDGKMLALDYHSNGAVSFGKENITANDMAAVKGKFADGGKFEHRGCHGGFPGGFCQELSKQVPQIETEGALLRSHYGQINKNATPNLSTEIPPGSAEKGVTKNEWVKYKKGERQ